MSSFLFALEQAGATCRIANTFRPKEACYLMHHAWMIWKGKTKPEAVPSLPGVLIEWVHKTHEESVNAAYQMCLGYQILRLQDAPARESNHTKGLAIDMSISWFGTLKIKDANDQEIAISSTPRDNMNQELWKVGASYKVIRYFRPINDIPHWSIDGH